MVFRALLRWNTSPKTATCCPGPNPYRVGFLEHVTPLRYCGDRLYTVNTELQWGKHPYPLKLPAQAPKCADSPTTENLMCVYLLSSFVLLPKRRSSACHPTLSLYNRAHTQSAGTPSFDEGGPRHRTSNFRSVTPPSLQEVGGCSPIHSPVFYSTAGHRRLPRAERDAGKRGSELG
jgi:hypothetical protein